MVPALLFASTMAIAPSAPVSSGRILVLDTVAPEVAFVDREQLDARVGAVLRAGKLALASESTRDSVRDCKTTLCRERTAADRGVTHWVRAEVEGEDRDYRITLSVGTIADSIEGPPILTSSGECHVCGIVELTAAIESQTTMLRDEMLASAPTPPTTMMRPTRAERDGPLPRDGGRVDAMRPTGIALLAAGSASAIGGAVLLGLDGNEIRRRCSADHRQNLDADGDCRYVHQTLGPGIAMLSGGVLAVAGGITLVSIERRRRRADLRMRLGYNRIVLSGRF